VAPLRYGAGMKGKIGEAMAHGIPVVTTSVGAQGMGLSASLNIMIADEPSEFAAAVIKLMEDDELYSTIRKNGLDYINNNFSIEALRSIIDCIFKERYPIKRFSLFDKISFFSGYFCERIPKLFKQKPDAPSMFPRR
jgi:glycosyltransferase involved in cell wall biosynthesis